jgi:beta-N-acetylhexosaminidase
MSLERESAGTFVVGFPGKEITPELRDLIRDGIAGCILFARNIGTAEEVANLCADLKRVARRPFLLCVDQEGGRVARLRGPPFTAIPSMRQVGQRNDPAFCEQVGRLIAVESRAVGFDWVFAPVLDVDTNPANPVIGDRSFSRDAEVVARLGCAVARGIESAGVASCGKHFPGHGDTSQDSHKTMPNLPHDLERLRRVDLVPFAAYARAGFASIMTAHVLFDAIDPSLPATLSAKVIDGVLRREIGFSGVIVSDDLEMKAIADGIGAAQAAALAMSAGVDLSLVCHRADVQRAAIESVVRGAESGLCPRSRLEQAHARVEAFARRFAAPAADPLAAVSALEAADHRLLAERIATATIRVPDPTEGHG